MIHKQDRKGNRASLKRKEIGNNEDNRYPSCIKCGSEMEKKGKNRNRKHHVAYSHTTWTCPISSDLRS